VVHPILLHRVRAVNTAPESENKIHDDRVAAQYGFRGGLVPGVTVYGYMTVPIVEFAPAWPARGTMEVRLLEPFYDGDEVVIKAEPLDDGSIRVVAERANGTICARGSAGMRAEFVTPPAPYPEAPLPPTDERPEPAVGNLTPGSALGTVTATLDAADPARLLQFSNDLLVRNFRLGPWIHTASEVTNWSVAHPGDTISARARILDRFDRKGHEFVVLDVTLVADRDRLIQTVRHTAIYRLRLR
jgi:acyl dehydratase